MNVEKKLINSLLAGTNCNEMSYRGCIDMKLSWIALGNDFQITSAQPTFAYLHEGSEEKIIIIVTS